VSRSVNRHLNLGRDSGCPFRHPTIVNRTLEDNFKKIYLSLNFMTVTPYRADCFQNHKELYQLLKDGKQRSIEKKLPQIISISQEISLIDPLAILQAIAKPNQLQFYLEKPNKHQAVAAIDATKFIKLEGKNRFSKAQDFISYCLNNSIIRGNLKLPFSGMHFFCSFTFFDETITNNSPFPAATIFLPRWQVSCSENSSVLVANLTIKPHSNLEFILESLVSQIKLINWQGNQLINSTENYHDLAIQTPKNAEQFKDSVTSAINSIQASQFRKIVLASTIDLVSNSPFNPINSLANLRKCYPGCNIFSTSNGRGKNFIGASPERLISIRNSSLETDALAGSAPRGQTTTEDAKFAYQLMSSEKERREHQFVLNFITECLSELGLTPQMLPMPQLLKLPNIQHLWTPIHSPLPSNLNPLEIVAKLHPTPAVAGVPTKIAQEQIRNYETFDRSLYAAPLGWVDYQGNCEFIVGIRSALIDTAKNYNCHQKNDLLSDDTYCAILYAGAGIVAGSDPNKELAEIQLKLQALSQALF
jgi:menaquinone-specific isochorismate synthase